MSAALFDLLAVLGLAPLDSIPEPVYPTEVTPGMVTLYVILGVAAAALAVFAVVFIVRKIRRRKDWWNK